MYVFLIVALVSTAFCQTTPTGSRPTQTVHSSGKSIPTPKGPAPTAAFRDAGKNAASPVVVTLNPTADHVLTGSAVPTINEADTDIEFSMGSKGADMVFSQNLTKMIFDSLESNCKSGPKDCDASQLITRALTDPAVRLRPRQFIAGALLALSALAGTKVLGEWFFAIPSPRRLAPVTPLGVHLSDPTVQALSNALDKGDPMVSIVNSYGTQVFDNFGAVPTIVAAPSPPQMTLVQNDGPNQRKGDIAVSFSSDQLARNFQGIIVRQSDEGCQPGEPDGPNPDLNCVASGAEWALVQAGFGGATGPLSALLTARVTIPAPPVIQPKLQRVIQWINNYTIESGGTQSGSTDQRATQLAIFALTTSFAVFRGQNLFRNNIFSGPLNLGSNAVSVTGSGVASVTTSKSCTTTPPCTLSACAGTLNPARCNSTPFKGCHCTVNIIEDEYDPNILQQQLSLWAPVTNMPNPTSTKSTSEEPLYSKTDLPTLTPTDSIPSGNKCIATANSTSCIRPGGQQQASVCVTKTYCAVSEPMRTDAGQLWCFPDNHCHDEPYSQAELAESFCDRNANKIMGPDTPPIVPTYAPYGFGVSWLRGCVTTSDNQSIGQPLPGQDSCTDIMRGIDTQCNEGQKNDHQGGWVLFGCLNYTFSALQKPNPCRKKQG